MAFEGIEFDMVIMNPPYEGSLQWDIMDESRKHLSDGGEVVYLGPIHNWQKEVLEEQNFKIGVNSITYLDRMSMCEWFNISIRNDCGIVHTYKDNTNTNYKDFEHIVENLHLRRKLKTYNDMNYLKFVSKEPSKKYSVRMFVGCNRDESHKWSVCPTTQERAFDMRVQNHIMFIGFNSENERNICYKYLCSNFVKAICKITRGAFTPILPDYTHTWTDQMLYDYFDLTEEEIREIESQFQ